MLWESEPDAEAQEALAALGITSVAFPSLANRPADGDFLTPFSDSLARLRSALATR